MNYAALIYALKGGKGSGNFHHQGIPGKRGGSASFNRVWGGVQQVSESKLSKLEVGAAGEKLAMKVLNEKFGVPFETLNVGINNAPIDVGGDHLACEVKAGLSTNGPTAQHWRATIGQPGKAETELLKKMTPDEKRVHNEYKSQQILKRKNDMLKQLSDIAGSEVKPLTVGIILSPDGKRGDVYLIPGFHLRTRWQDAEQYFVGSYDVS